MMLDTEWWERVTEDRGVGFNLCCAGVGAKMGDELVAMGEDEGIFGDGRAKDIATASSSENEESLAAFNGCLPVPICSRISDGS